MNRAIVPNNKADIMPTTTVPLFAATPMPPLELELDEVEVVEVPEAAEPVADLVALAEPEPDDADEVGATETRFLTVLQDALESEEELV